MSERKCDRCGDTGKIRYWDTKGAHDAPCDNLPSCTAAREKAEAAAAHHALTGE